MAPAEPNARSENLSTLNAKAQNADKNIAQKEPHSPERIPELSGGPEPPYSIGLSE
jgi:hypothetical protein